MATSFRLSDEQMKRLSFLADRLGKSKAQIVKDAIDKLYEEESQRSTRSMLDRLTDNKFEPLDFSDAVDASDPVLQRATIREKISKKNRN